MKKSIFFVFALSIGMLNAQTPVDIESAQTITGQKTFTASLLLGTGSPALSFSGATTTGLGRSTGVGFTAIDGYFSGTETFQFTSRGRFVVANFWNTTTADKLGINVYKYSYGVDEDADGQDGGINVTTYGGDLMINPTLHTSTFTGRTASGSAAVPQPSQTNQALAEFTGKGWHYTTEQDGDFDIANRGVFGVYSADIHTTLSQAAYCAIQTTKIGETNDHFSFLIDHAGNAGLVYKPGIGPVFHTTTPNGWDAGTGYPTRFFSVESETNSADVGLLIQNGSASGGTKGINIWLDNSANISYLDNLYSTDDNGKFIIRLKSTLATPLSAMSIITTSGTSTTAIGIGGNITAPVSALHIDRGNNLASEIRLTTGTSGTGQLASDGFSLGITTGGVAEIRQREDKDMTFYTGATNTLRLSVLKTGEIITGSIGSNAYRTTNTSSVLSAHLFIDPTSSTTGSFQWGIDDDVSNTGFFCTQVNNNTPTGRRIVGMMIKPMNTSSTAGAEKMAMGFFTQTGGTVATEKFRIEGDGRIYGTAIHNNTGAVTGTTNQYIASGTYTPTLTNVANISASAAYSCQWIRVGNVVTVSGKIDVTPSSTIGSPTTQVGISLPIASSFTITDPQCAGTAYTPGVAGQGAAIEPDYTFDRAQMDWKANDATNQSMFFSFTYVVL